MGCLNSKVQKASPDGPQERNEKDSADADHNSSLEELADQNDAAMPLPARKSLAYRTRRGSVRLLFTLY